MLVDLKEYGKPSIEVDLCIIGAGAAGVTIARQFVGTKKSVCLLESGGDEYESNTQSLYQGSNSGLPYFDLTATRLRYFGGTTNHWTGRCAPLDPIDFRHRPWVQYSGWPITREDIDPYYKTAQTICGLGEFVYDERVWDKLSLDAPPPTFDPDRLTVKFWQFSSPVPRFGRRYEDLLAAAQDLMVLLHANVTNIKTTENGSHVDYLEVSSLEGQRATVRAKQFVLACGGIENPRVLLLSNSVESAGIGNRNDLVGCFFMEHPKARTGNVLATNPHRLLDTFRKHFPDNTNPYWAAITLSDQAQEKHQALNSSAALYYEPKENSGAAAVGAISRAFKDDTEVDDWAGKIWSLVKDIDVFAGAMYRRHVEGKAPITSPGILYFWCRGEQAPNPDSRITLTQDKDALGLNRVDLKWQLRDIDRNSLKALSRTIGEEFGRLGLGRVQLEDWLFDASADWLKLDGGHHHMGTTRMSESPRTGVVNKNCRVHECDNLYLAGSSVFPTGGWANPTLTIVAMALRLAEHLKRLSV